MDDRAAGGAFPTGDQERGERLADSLRCLACHSLEGSQPPPAATPLTRLTPGSRLWTDEADASDHPRHGLTPDQEAAVERALVADRASFERLVPAEYAERQIRSSGCLACHGRDGALPAWRAAALPDDTEPGDSADDFFDHASPDRGDGPDQAPPDLTWAGEKLRSDWLESYLGGRTDGSPRPHLVVRMPAFPEHAAPLAAGLHHQHGMAPSTPVGGQGRAPAPPARLPAQRPEGAPRTPDRTPTASLPPSREDALASDDLAEIGRDLIQADRLGCQTCHAVGSEPALGGEGSVETVNLQLARRRLRRPWFDRFLRDPARMLPGTKMPRFVDEYGYTSLFDVLDGEAERQFDAIWSFLGSLDRPPD